MKLSDLLGEAVINLETQECGYLNSYKGREVTVEYTFDSEEKAHRDLDNLHLIVQNISVAEALKPLKLVKG